MSFFPLEPETFDRLTKYSERLHRNQHLLPLAAWVLENRDKSISVRDAMRALGGVDRARAGEALDRLVAIGAMTKLPKATDEPNEKRLYKALTCHYWNALPGFLDEAKAVANVEQ